MYTIANVHPFGHNVGNRAIHVALRQMLHEAFGRLVSLIEIPATILSSESGSAGLTAESVHEINRFADGVIVGGGNLFENDALVVDPRALAALQPPLMLFSNSWGRIYDRFERLKVRSDSMSTEKLTLLVQRADLSLSRDSVTHEFVRRLDAKDQLGWCPTIGLSRYRHILPPLPANEEVGALISVRTPQLMNIPYRFQNHVAQLIDRTIDDLRDAGHDRIRILCNDSRDLDFATVFRFTRSVDSVFASDVYEYLSLLSRASLVVSFRLHATLPAIAYGTPVINISYDERAESLIRDLGVGQANLDLIHLGTAFQDALTELIRTGGYSSFDHEEAAAAWSDKAELQLDALRQFRTLVSNYMTQDSVRA